MEFACNANFKGEFGKNVDLCQLHKSTPNSKLCMKPYQLVVKDLKGTLILFSNGKFRTMGCIDELEASFLVIVRVRVRVRGETYLEKLFPSTSFPSITLQ